MTSGLQAAKIELIETLRAVTEGKIFVELERARLTQVCGLFVSGSQWFFLWLVCSLCAPSRRQQETSKRLATF